MVSGSPILRDKNIGARRPSRHGNRARSTRDSVYGGSRRRGASGRRPPRSLVAHHSCSTGGARFTNSRWESSLATTLILPLVASTTGGAARGKFRWRFESGGGCSNPVSVPRRSTLRQFWSLKPARSSVHRGRSATGSAQTVTYRAYLPSRVTVRRFGHALPAGVTAPVPATRN